MGLAIAYGGVDDSNKAADRDLGTALATQTYLVLKDLATHSSVFSVASYFDPLFTQLLPSGNVVIDVYLIVRPNNLADTCDAQNHQPV